ncbi:unnamed protein product, partial [Ectocarpus sp. 12 AP-2014]
ASVRLFDDPAVSLPLFPAAHGAHERHPKGPHLCRREVVHRPSRHQQHPAVSFLAAPSHGWGRGRNLRVGIEARPRKDQARTGNQRANAAARSGAGAKGRGRLHSW